MTPKNGPYMGFSSESGADIFISMEYIYSITKKHDLKNDDTFRKNSLLLTHWQSKMAYTVEKGHVMNEKFAGAYTI